MRVEVGRGVGLGPGVGVGVGVSVGLTVGMGVGVDVGLGVGWGMDSVHPTARVAISRTARSRPLDKAAKSFNVPGSSSMSDFGSH